jgi:hypothetical protein
MLKFRGNIEYCFLCIFNLFILNILVNIYVILYLKKNKNFFDFRKIMIVKILF